VSEELFEKYLKNDLSEEEERRLGVLLKDPASARDFVSFLQEWSVVADLSRQMGGRQARVPLPEPAGGVRLWAPLLAAAAGLLLVFGIWAVRRPAPTPRPDAPREELTALPAPPPAVVPQTAPAPSPRPLPDPRPAPLVPARPADPVKEAPPPAPPAPPPAPLPPPLPAPAPSVPPTVAVAGIAVLEEATAHVEVGVGKQRVRAEAGRTLHEGEGVATIGAASRAVLKFPDGTRIEVGADTAVESLSENPAGKRLALGQGDLKAAVAPQPKGKPFALLTPHAQATVLGTELQLSVSSERSRLTVLHGLVRFGQKGAAAGGLDVKGGQSATVHRGPRPEGRLIALEMSFQDGVWPGPDYAGTADTRLSELEPARNFGALTEVEADGDEVDKKVLYGLLRWDLSAIPAGARVLEAWITFSVSGPSSGSDKPYHVYALKRPWTEAEATWQGAASGRPWRQAGARAKEDRGTEALAVIVPLEKGELRAMLNEAGLAQLQAWVRQPATNFGVLLGNDDNSNGFRFESREVKAPERRPKLTVLFTAPSGR
jgi:hypothetical protein